MPDSFGDYHSLSWAEVNRAIFQFNDQVPAHDIEELILLRVLVPVVLPLHNPKAHDRFVNSAKGLIVPRMTVLTN